MLWCGVVKHPINKARAIYINKDSALWFTRLLYMLSDAVAEPGPLDDFNKTFSSYKNNNNRMLFVPYLFRRTPRASSP